MRHPCIFFLQKINASINLFSTCLFSMDSLNFSSSSVGRCFGKGGLQGHVFCDLKVFMWVITSLNCAPKLWRAQSPGLYPHPPILFPTPLSSTNPLCLSQFEKADLVIIWHPQNSRSFSRWLCSLSVTYIIYTVYIMAGYLKFNLLQVATYNYLIYSH